LESANAETETADYAAQQKKLEGIVAPIVAKLYGQEGQGTTTPSASGSGPTVEEVD
jgi:hypothetical protein